MRVGTSRKRTRGARFGLLALLPILSVFVVTFAVSASGTTASCSNPATLGSGASGSAFEIDTSANLIVNTAGCIDWLNAPNNGQYRAGVLPKNDKPTGST